ncbi:aminotransferase class IV [Angustibacter sp. McL0619]|uniref:aminotransferase class IV n=1 Tax=Angustibacter sp. McL0619 TaxID=3415676 RepID=UPI003CEB42A8
MTDDGLRAWVNGSLVDPGAPSLAALDHGLTVGDGVFETLRVVDGVPFALTRHLRRLASSAGGLGLVPPDADRLREGIDQVLAAAEPLARGRLRLTMTGGVGPLGSGRADVPPSYVVVAGPVGPHEEATTVAVVPWTRNERSAVAGLKTTSYAENVVALAYASARGGTEALFANTRGQLCEGTGSNVFLAVGARLLTPPLSSGCLAGITRELLIEWAIADGVDVAEAELGLDDLRAADEVMLTSSTRDVQAVAGVDDRRLDAPGPLTRRMAELFARRAADDLDP